MKRKFRVVLFFLIFLIGLCCSTDTISAATQVGYSSSRYHSCVNEGTCIVLCGYTNEAHMYGNLKNQNVIYSSYIYYSFTDDKFFVSWWNRENNPAAYVYGEHVQDWSHKYVKKSSPADDSLKNGVCPKNSYVDDADFFSWANEVCFDNGTYCKEDGSDLGTTFTGTSLLEYNYINDIDTWISGWSFGDIDCMDYIQRPTPGADVSNTFIPTDTLWDTGDKFKNDIKDKFIRDWKNYLHTNNIPTFLTNILNDKFDDLYENNYQPFYNTCVEQYRNEVNNGNMSQEQMDQAVDNITVTEDELNETTGSVIDSLQHLNQTSQTPSINYIPICGLFGPKTFGYIKFAFTVFKILVPVLVILLGMLDFVRIVFTGEDKDMKTSGTRFLKRVIIGVILLLLPALLDFVFNLVGFSENCIQQLL